MNPTADTAANPMMTRKVCPGARLLRILIDNQVEGTLANRAKF
jgi:hypothetical protein